MAQSATVVSKTLATAAAYNNLRLDVLSPTLGHTHDGTNGSAVLDDTFISWGTGLDTQFLWSTADASNHAAVLALGASQSLHITDVGAKATDWNIAATTHPNLYIHSNTTPATDFLRLGDHDGTTAYIDVVGGTTLAMEIAGTTYSSLTATALTLSDAVEINMQEAIVWTGAGAAVTAGDYSIGRDDSTVQHFNVPTGATYEWSVNDVYIMGLTATELAVAAGVDFKVDSIIEGNGLSGVSISGLQVSGTGLISRTAGVYVYQDLSSGAVPALRIDQTDVSEEMIEFITTIGTGNAIEAKASKTLTETHFIKITIPGGLTRYIPCGTIA